MDNRKAGLPPFAETAHPQLQVSRSGAAALSVHSVRGRWHGGSLSARQSGRTGRAASRWRAARRPSLLVLAVPGCVRKDAFLTPRGP